MGKRKNSSAKAKHARRVPGTGSVRQLADGTWVGRRPVGHYPNGFVKYVQRAGSTVEEMQRRLDAAAPKTDGITLSAWLSHWLAEMKCKPRTRRSRESAVKHHIGPALGHLKVAAVTPRQVELAISKWKGSAATACKNASILGTALSAAVRAEIRTDNPVQFAPRPKITRKKIDPFTREELERIVAEAARRPNTRAIALIAVTGLRAGEALALDVGDYAGGELSVTKTIGEKRGEMGTPKTSNGVRVVRVPDPPPEARAALSAAIGARKTGPVFLSSRRRRAVHRVLLNAFGTLLRRLEIRPRGLHQLRHSTHTHMLAAGIPVADVAAYHGNTPAVVMNTYAHALKASIDPAAAIERLFASERRVTDAADRGAKRKKS